jgi:RNA-directed DNA polymerase
MRELMKLGASLSAFISVAMSRKGFWRLARTLATQSGMTNK